MRISHKYKYVFIANQKTASSAIRFALDEYSDIKGVHDESSPYYYHTSARELKHHFKKNNWNWDEYFKFSFVRNPFDLAVSHYFYRQKMLKRVIAESEDKWLVEFLNQSYISSGFSNWLKKINGDLTFIENKASDQYSMICDKNNEILIDFVGKYENITQDYMFICEKLKLPKNLLTYVNKSHHSHYSTYYTKTAKKIISNKYKVDIEKFGYSFDED